MTSLAHQQIPDPNSNWMTLPEPVPQWCKETHASNRDVLQGVAVGHGLRRAVDDDELTFAGRWTERLVGETAK